MRKTLALAAVLAALPIAASAQTVAAVKPLYEDLRGWLIASAQQMPEADYGFKPTPDVRSFGEQIGHVANANFMFCSRVLGKESPNRQNLEEVSSKAELVAGIEASFAFCDEAYEIDDATAMGEITFFRQQGTRLWVLIYNATHDAQHYGSLVTYMRLKGMVPPSSQGGGM